MFTQEVEYGHMTTGKQLGIPKTAVSSPSTRGQGAIVWTPQTGAPTQTPLQGQGNSAGNCILQEQQLGMPGAGRHGVWGLQGMCGKNTGKNISPKDGCGSMTLGRLKKTRTA